MGQFTVRPEEPTEWAGLPSEPAEARPAAESLAAPAESADTLAFLGGAVESIAIPLAPSVDVASTVSASEEDSAAPRAD
jgi:hypothetical protein